MREVTLRKIAVLVLLVSAFTVTIRAQQLATLNVRVTDQNGGVIPQAKVTIQSIDTGTARSSYTGNAGVAIILGLPAGNYKFTTSADHFEPQETQLSLTVGQFASVLIALSIEKVKERVEVHEASQSVDPQTPQVSQIIERKMIADLPSPGRDFIDYVLLTPTVNVGRSTAVGSQSPFTETVLELSFGGLRETHSSFFGIDGVDYTTSVSGIQRASPSQEWVQEFRVEDGPYTADNGSNLGSVVNTVTKSGGNAVHGSAYEFFRNNDLDAENLLAAPGFNALRFNQFGAYVGGPVRPTKNFYFLGYEGQRSAESPIYSSFILNCINSPGCFGPGTPSINQVKESLGLQPENLGSILQIDDFDRFFVKSSNVLSDKTTLNVGYLFDDDRKNNAPGASPGEGLPSSFRYNPVRDQTAYANLFHFFGGKWASENILNYGQRTFRLDPIGAGFEPALDIPDLLYSGGYSGSNRYYRERHFEAAENLTYIRGNHTFKFGADFEPVWIAAQPTFFSPGLGIFTPQTFFGTAPPFGPGTAVEFLFLEPREFFGQQIPTRTLPFQSGIYAGPAAAVFDASTQLNFWHKLFSLYAQDQWNLRPNLVFLLGLRYYVDFFPSAADLHLVGQVQPTNYGNIQPRFGLAYAFRGGRSVVRAGFGLFTGPFDYSTFIGAWEGGSAFTPMQQPLLPAFAHPATDLGGFGLSGPVGIEGPVLAGSAFGNFTHNGIYPSPGTLIQFPFFVQRKFDNPYAEHVSLEVENEIAKDLFVSVGYRFIHALKLPVFYSINGLPNGDLPSGVQDFVPADPNFGFALYGTPSGYSIYNAGTLSLRKSFAHHYSVLGNYTFSKSIDIATEIQFTDVPYDYLNPGLDRAVSDNDVRHRFTLALQADTPPNWPVLLRNFNASVLTTLQSPRYYTIFAGFDVNGDQFPFSDRVGDIGRNTYRGDPSYTTNVRLQRTLSFTEQLKGEFSVEAFNLFNRPNILDIDTVYDAPEFLGPVPTHYGDHITSPANPSFGSPKFVAPPRQMQLSFRVKF